MVYRSDCRYLTYSMHFSKFMPVFFFQKQSAIFEWYENGRYRDRGCKQKQKRQTAHLWERRICDPSKCDQFSNVFGIVCSGRRTARDLVTTSPNNSYRRLVSDSQDNTSNPTSTKLNRQKKCGKRQRNQRVHRVHVGAEGHVGSTSESERHQDPQ